jgi:hypothetical protein
MVKDLKMGIFGGFSSEESWDDPSGINEDTGWTLSPQALKLRFDSYSWLISADLDPASLFTALTLWFRLENGYILGL